jgi:peptidoglycan/LPS O-acetylase OafA/YrhL
MFGLAVWAVVATAVSQLAGWPAQFMSDKSTPDGGYLAWLVAGTALSAPVGFVLLMVVAGLLARPRGPVGYVGDGLAVVVAVVTLVGSLGETFSPDPVTAPRGVLVASGVLGAVIVVGILATVVHDVRLRRAHPRAEHGAVAVST